MPTYAGWYLRRQRARQQLRLHDLTSSFVKEYGESYYDIAHFDELNNVLYYNTFVNGLEESGQSLLEPHFNADATVDGGVGAT